MRNKYQKEIRLCDKCVDRVNGVAMINGKATRLKVFAPSIRRQCRKCGKRVNRFWHAPYVTPKPKVHHPLPGNDVFIGRISSELNLHAVKVG